MTKKTGLGKGLDALLINNVVEEEKVHEGEVVQKLKLIEVEPNRDQPRRNFDEEAIEDLSNSIRAAGNKLMVSYAAAISGNAADAITANYYNNESPSLSIFWFLVKAGFITLIYILTMGAIYYS